MRLVQEATEFQPIAIVLETREEVALLWSYVEKYYLHEDSPTRKLMIEISNALGEATL